MYLLSLSSRITPRTITIPSHMMSSMNPKTQSGTRILWGIGADEYAAPMWAVMLGKARNDGFTVMSRMSAMYRMAVVSSTHRVARLPRSRALVRLRMWAPVVTGLKYLTFSQVRIIGD